MLRRKEEGEIVVEINYTEVYDLVGKLLTFIDATYQDKQQRDAQKTLLKHTVYDWYNNIEKSQNPDKYEELVVMKDGSDHKWGVEKIK